MLVLQALQGLGTLMAGQPVKVPDPEANALGEREVYKDLNLPAHIDSMMHEHGKFLVEFGAPWMPLCHNKARIQFVPSCRF